MSGLTEENALKALTFTPATLAGAYNTLGSLEPGKTANFIVTNGNIFKAETKILQNWCNGASYDVTVEKSMPREKMGTYDLKAGDKSYTFTLKGKPDAPEAQLMTPDSLKLKATFSFSPGGLVTLTFQPDTLKKGTVALSGAPVSSGWSGTGTLPDGTWINWNATQTKGPGGEREKQPAKQNPVTPPEIGAVTYPFTAFGWKEKPQAQTVLIRNATVWTGEKDGILPSTDVLVSNGKIQRIGRRLPVQDNATVIDGTGKHLTAGIIDEHSHIAITRNVNEGTQESTSEVRIGDVVDSEDVDIYRQLAGGVTSSHLLHGSANPIGGQTQLIKLRWGLTPEEMKFQNWPGFIKFALGENVKQSSSPNSTRFPQTRMGVEETFDDYFTRAQEYGKLKRSGRPFRKDLELEALLEIIESKRFITCHSYVQSEITMMMRVAERFGFRLNTFTHILEGYKVADKMAKHGAGGSSFSDWWAYKYEVYEAIPQNARIMADQGVVVAINSDDAEMARRLNQEAAKSVMYAGMSQEDAWKMVTINPAKLMHVDDRTGSVKAGKDADLVLWNDNPLSIYASADKTWVDGTLYFDREQDTRLQDEVQRERARIIQKMQAEKKGGEGGERPRGPKEHYHCDTEGDEGN
jgi:imidazolonepropionase-like amidohydrolase